MTPEIFKQAAVLNEWSFILPEIMLGVTAIALLLMELFLSKKNHDLIPSISIAAQLGVASALLVHFRSNIDFESFGGLLHHTTVSQALRIFFMLTSVLVTFIGMISLQKQKLPRVEFFHITLVVTAAMMLLAQANHFVALFVALETVTIGFYILVSYYRNSSASLEAGLKYLILGGLSSAIMLFGISLLYGVAGNKLLPGGGANPLGFDNLRIFLQLNPDNFLASVGIVLVLAGVLFKIGAVPFQVWVPDVYQGAPTPVTAFLAVGSKAAGFAVLLTLAQTFDSYQGLVISVLTVVAIATILFGNLAALTQHNVKRLMALSGVAHAGYLLIAVIAYYEIQASLSAIIFYLFAYLLASMAVFTVMAIVAGEKDAEQDLSNYADLAKQQPFLAAVLAIGLGSLAGIPPLAGFIGKLLVFIYAFKAGLYSLLVVAIIGVVISIYYYFGWIKAAYFSGWRISVAKSEGEASQPSLSVSSGVIVVLTLLAASSVVLGFYQGAFGHWLLGR